MGAYKCKNCGCEIVPTYSEVLWAIHRATTRHLKCPKCEKRIRLDKANTGYQPYNIDNL